MTGCLLPILIAAAFGLLAGAVLAAILAYAIGYAVAAEAMFESQGVEP